MGIGRNGTNGFIRLATVIAVLAGAAAIVVPAGADIGPARVEVSHVGPDTVVTEGGPTDIYIMRLSTRPTADVFVTVEPRGDVTLSSTTLAFTPDNFNSYQGLLVSAMNDLHTEVTETVMLRHTAASADARFRGAAPFSPSDEHPVVILDNDRAPTIVVPDGDVCVASNEVDFAGLGGRGQPMTVIVDGDALVLAVVAGDETWETSAMIPDGDHTAFARDGDGRVSAPVSFSVDTVQPVITSPSPGDVVGPSVTVTGTASPGAHVVLSDGAGNQLGSTTAADDGTWSIDVQYAASGSQTLRASGCGVTPTSAPVEFIVDATGPVLVIATSEDPQIAPLEPLIVEGTASDLAGVIEVTAVVVDVTGEETAAEVICTGCPGQDVSWSASGSDLPGEQTMVVTAVDGFGNTSSREITILKI